MNLILPPPLRARIEAEARAAFPRECCGLIEGRRRGDDAEATAILPARNLAGRSDRFEVHPEDHFAALKAARSRGLDLIGCYHSHPDGASLPSPSDRGGAGEEDFLWVIAALAGPGAPIAIKAFVYAAGEFRRADLADVVGAGPAIS